MLKWRQLRGRIGRLSGDASANSLVNLSMARIISPEDVEAIMANQPGQGEAEGSPEQPLPEEAQPPADPQQE